MKAIILAAGRGERMRPYTDTLPKPLLEVGGKPLIVWHVEKLAAAGINRIVINHAHLGSQIEARLGRGAAYGVDIQYSREERALETAGGIANALSLLDDVFAAVNGDVYSDYPYERLAALGACLDAHAVLAHLVLVSNPQHHPDGDFALCEGRVTLSGPRLTFSGIAVYRREMFQGIAGGAVAPLAPLLRDHIALGQVRGEHHGGRWCDVGTPQRLEALRVELAQH